MVCGEAGRQACLFCFVLFSLGGNSLGGKKTSEREGTLKEVGVPLTAMGREAATLLEPAIGSGAASPALGQTHKLTTCCLPQWKESSHHFLAYTVWHLTLHCIAVKQLWHTGALKEETGKKKERQKKEKEKEKRNKEKV